VTKYDDLDLAGLLVCLVLLAIWALFSFLLACRRPRNKRTGLPAPKPDARSSIEQFRRIHTS
jgi:hypothetical protein